jgi:hypothetical protein
MEKCRSAVIRVVTCDKRRHSDVAGVRVTDSVILRAAAGAVPEPMTC